MTRTLEPDATGRTVEGRYRLHLHEAGDGPALVLLHGSGPGVSGWSNFKGNLPVLAERFRTLVPDLPGFGHSDRVTLDRAYPRVAAEAVCSLLDELGIERAHLLGNSMGGYVAAELALAQPERVDRLVLMGPGGLAVNPLGPDQSEGARRLSEFMLAPSRDAMRAWIDCMVADKRLITDELVDERMANAMAPGAIESAMEIFLSLMQHPEPVPLWARAAAITQPTLITWGRDDRMLPVEGALFAFRRMPDAELHLFSRCGHWAQVERKDDFERLVTDFLTRPGRV
ncbi:MAG: alpha/beta fold hydrolase [Actinobacteria bacterium]|nr:alpha/beta fold hydrolase [Actinomycetota bacterium]